MPVNDLCMKRILNNGCNVVINVVSDNDLRLLFMAKNGTYFKLEEDDTLFDTFYARLTEHALHSF